MADHEQREAEPGGGSQTPGSRGRERFDEAHRETPGEGSTPGAGHPSPGEGVGLPDEGPGRANEQAAPPMDTSDQAGFTEASSERRGLDAENEE
jgi:hypothetical protein